MDRKQFLRNLSILAVLPILGCGVQSTTDTQEQFMGNAKGEGKATATVSYKVIDKDGNVKLEKTETVKLENK
jgi:hypothetical protein